MAMLTCCASESTARASFITGAAIPIDGGKLAAAVAL
jgi:hypothetical protein